MKIYQLIYTSAEHSLSDNAKGLSNKSGLNVYSCSQAVTRENINEILRFSLYRMPNRSAVEYSDKPFDPTVPELFPKTFRTIRLSDGRYAAIQVVYSGVDFKGDIGNQFAHALIFDETDDDFIAESYYGSPLFRTYLTEEEQKTELVQYLPELEDKRDEELEAKVSEFIKCHKQQMQYFVIEALEMLISDHTRNMCISTASEELTDMYLISLKYLLPKNVSRYMGISTYNVYLPSEKQFNIVFCGTVKGKNNITREAVETRTSCKYIDDDRTNYYTERELPIFKFDLKTLRKLYSECNFTSVTGLYSWFDTFYGELAAGIGAKLLHLQQTVGDNALRSRLNQIYPLVGDSAHREVRFELLKILYDNSEKLPSREENITVEFVRACVKKLCDGEEYPVSENCAGMTRAQGKILAGNIRLYMKMIAPKRRELSAYNVKVLLELFALIKHTSNKYTWRELFLKDKDMLTDFVMMGAAYCIDGEGTFMFIKPDKWEKRDLSELVALIDASTTDNAVKWGCLKYMTSNPDEEWGAFGISFRSKDKTKEEQEQDLKRVRRMLLKVGYLPFEKKDYMGLEQDVYSDMTDNLNPLLLSRLLNAYYNWRASAGHQTKAEKRANELKKYLLKIRSAEPEIYNFIIPKLALEIVEAPGHYHDIIINPQTMPPSFWNWFIIGYNKCQPDDNRILNYSRVYLSNKADMDNLEGVGPRLKQTFRQMR